MALLLTWPASALAEPENGGAAPPCILLRVETKDPGVAVARVLPDGTHQPLCAAPCSQLVDRRDIFVLNEDGRARSPALSLPESDREITLSVRRRSGGLQRTGEALIALGFAAQFIGFLAVGGDPAPADMMMDRASSPRDGRFLALGLGGIVAAGVGLYLVLRGRGRVDSSTGNSFVLSD